MSFPAAYYKLLYQRIKKQGNSSYEEILALIRTFGERSCEGRPVEAYSAQELAVDLVDIAWESSDAIGALYIAQALSLWPDCLRAYDYLSLVEKSKKKRLAYVEKGVDIGRRLFGGQSLEELVSDFHHNDDPQIYMRLLENLARISFEQGKVSKAIVIWEDMLRLNAADHQGVRNHLMTALLLQRDFKTYHDYRWQYDEDSSIVLFNDAWLALVEKGDSQLTGRQLRAAAARNPHVIPLLLQPAPPAKLPIAFADKSPEEAILYACIAWPYWREVPAALALLQAAQENRPAPLPPGRLSPGGRSLLCNNPFSPASPLQLRPDLQDEEVAQLPFLRLNRELLAAIQEVQALQLTAKGSLPRALVKRMYDLRLFPSENIDKGSIKLLQEKNFRQLAVARLLAEVGRWTQKRKGKIILTKKGLQLLQAPPAVFYRELLEVYAQQYNWTYTELWPSAIADVGQWGWGLVMYELLRQGDTARSSAFYAGLYFEILPQLLTQYRDTLYASGKERATHVFRYRLFEGFFRLFGLVDLVSEVPNSPEAKEGVHFRRSALAARVFSIG